MPTLNFKGKSFVYNHHLAVKYHQLIPKPELSLTDKVSLHDNLIINGDNLKALKALLPTYAGKVKCIYIDPPYNTGNENWMYNDNVNSPMMREWVGKIVDKDDLTRHDKWLCMLLPRLKLLKELLCSNGVILVSIDDNEVSYLTSLMDEIFERENHIATFVWRRRVTSSLAATWISMDHEYVLCYCKDPEKMYVFGEERDMTKYSIPDGKGKYYASMPLTVGMSKEMRPNQWYELKNPKTGKGYYPPKGRVWGFIPPSMNEKINKDLIIFPEDYPEKNLNTPRLKSYPEDAKRDRKPVSTWIFEQNVKIDQDSHIYLKAGKNEEGTRALKDIFEDVNFQYAKPVSLIKALIRQFTSNNDIVLDSFAGSGTTAQAILELNKEDGQHRQFILVEMEDYADTITAERVRKFILKNRNNGELFNHLFNFSYFKLGETIEMESILSGKKLPSYKDLARYVFYTSTGEQFDTKAVNEKKNYIGSSKEFEVYMFYKPDIEYLKKTALTLDIAKSLGDTSGKKRLVFAPAKFVDTHSLLEMKIEYCQLPFEIYRIKN